MGNLLDEHATRLKKIVKKHGRPVILTDLTGTPYPAIFAVWNDVEHALKISNLEEAPMGAKSSLYFDRDSLQTETGEIKPEQGWIATGSPNAYDDDKDYIIEIPKEDKQLPGILLFLSEDQGADVGWGQVSEL